MGELDLLRQEIDSNMAAVKEAETLALERQEPKREALTDMGNARRLVKRSGQDLRFCDPLGGWLVWDGRRWAHDATGAVWRMAKGTVRAIYREAEGVLDDKDAKAIASWASSSQSAHRLRAMVEVAQSEQEVIAQPGDFDARPMLLNVLNGTLDLRTGDLRPHDPAAMLTHLAGASYDPEASDVVLERYLADATGEDPDFLAFLQRAAGYSLTGDISEEAFFLMLGPTCTGKSTFIEMMLALLGSYAQKASFDTFLETRGMPGVARPDLARLRGARLVAAVEAAKTRHLAEVMVKELTGGDTVTTRYLYHDDFSFKPLCKLWLAANVSPRISDDDSAIWRRLRRLPFEHAPAKPDPEVKRHLTTDAGALSAALAWAVRGCLTWQDTRLLTCARVDEGTGELRAEMDPLSEFLRAYCILAKGAQVDAQALRAAYETWARECGAKAVGNVEWGKRLRARGCQDRRERRSGLQLTIWHGIGLAEAVNEELPI